MEHISQLRDQMKTVGYINRKRFYSLSVHACVHATCLFFDVGIKWPGSVHYAHVFANFSINQMLIDGSIPCATVTRLKTAIYFNGHDFDNGLNILGEA